MKLKAIAAVCALAFASQAHALNPATTLAAGTNHVFVSGSSALQVTIGQIAAAMFQPGTIDVYFDASGNGANYRAYSGTFKAGITGVTAGTNGVIYEQANGGSLMGIIPVASANSVNAGLPATAILNLNTCTNTGTVDSKSGGALWTCTGSTPAVADAGVADVEPALFTGINIPAGSPSVTPVMTNGLNITSSLAQPMAIITTTNNTAVTSLTKAEVTALMDGLSTDWSYISSAAPAAAPVTVCRRVAGSGTQATINDFFYGFPCSSSVQSPAAHQVVANFGAGGGNYTVIENSSSGALAACMTAVQKGTAPGYTINITNGTISTAAADATHVTLPANGVAIGLMGLDRQPGAITNVGINGATGITETYKFVSIDGVVPSVENATTGAYDIWVGNSWQSRNSTVNGIAPMAAGSQQLAFYNALVSTSGNPAILGASKTPAVPGVAALSTYAYDPTTVASGAYAGTLLNPVMRVSKGNSCQPAQQVQ